MSSDMPGDEDAGTAGDSGAAGTSGASGANGGAAGAAGAAGIGSMWPPFEATGQPITATANRWTYIEFPDALCRDGSPTGISVNLGSAKKLMIFLEGGGECVDAQTCLLNPNNRDHFLSTAQWTFAEQGTGVFDRNNDENPVGDWNFVYVHYCSGDRHGGANPNGNVPGVGPQQFVGYLNMQKFLNRLVPTFSDATDVLLTGVSAGGFGATRTTVLVQRAFANVKLKLINDSGPPASTAILAECMQERWRTLFNFQATFLADCGAACPNPNDYWLDYGVFLAKVFSDRPSGLIISIEDLVERAYFGVSRDNCTAPLDLLVPLVTGPELRADLLGFRELVRPYQNFGTFYPAGEAHTFIQSESFYTATAGGVRLVDWFRKIVNGESPGHAGP